MSTYAPKRGDLTNLRPFRGSGVELAAQRNLRLVDPATPTGVQPVGKSAGYTLAFSDEFGGSALDRSKWDVAYPDTPFWNATQPGGHLTNTGEPQAYAESGITFPGGAAGSVMQLTLRNQVTVPGLPYTSGMVTSYPSFNPTYCYAEARMKLNDTARLWPAFWMDPTNTAGWPVECELDIMENFPDENGFNNLVRNTLIWGGSDSPSLKEYSPSGSLELWHTYAAEWRPGEVTWYVDGVQSHHFTDASFRVPSTPHYLILNLAGDKDIDPLPSALPQSVYVDWVRVWN